ncbi:MAG: pyruvate dehydrogenase complex dihydrolipoamide acetyltransferase [Chthoniobacter sp.]|nr:pyruvate dehydrogenase complex dihydrolipoamide acetyltransferase [Chthoniobacter sp.]
MAIYIEMPKLSDTMTEGTLLKWRKNEGDKVETGDVLAEVETDKATMEMEAFDDGILHRHLVSAGGKVAVGAKIGLLLQKGEAPPADGAAIPDSPKSASAKADTISEAPATRASAQAASAPMASGPGGRVKASPLAKKIAAEKGVQLSALSGSGPGGRIVAKDVQTAQPGARSAAPVGIAPMPAGPDDLRLPLSGMRRVIAERLLVSKTTIPHFYLNIEVDAGPLMKFRAEANAASEAAGGAKLTVNDFVLKAVVAAAVKVPAVNASFAGDAIIQYRSVNLSVAVAVEDGLVTPVIRDAQDRTIREISEAVKDLATRARGKKLKPEEYAGGTLTVSNLGSYGIDSFSAIINPPQALIIAVGAIVKKPVVNAKNEIVVGQRLAIGLSADHRVVDGAVGAQYLGELRALLESPALMLL